MTSSFYLLLLVIGAFLWQILAIIASFGYFGAIINTYCGFTNNKKGHDLNRCEQDSMLGIRQKLSLKEVDSQIEESLFEWLTENDLRAPALVEN